MQKNKKRRCGRRGHSRKSKAVRNNDNDTIKQQPIQTDALSTNALNFPTVTNTVHTQQHQSVRRSPRIKNKLSPSRGSQLTGNTGFLFSNDFLSESNSVIRRGSRRLRSVHHSPNVFTIDEFLTSNEIAHFVSIAQSNGDRFEESYVQATVSQNQIISKERTSTFIFLPKYLDKVSRAIEARAAEIVSLSIENVEPLQIVRYSQGQQFTLHHDAGTLIPIHKTENTKKTVSVPPLEAYSESVSAVLTEQCNSDVSALQIGSAQNPIQIESSSDDAETDSDAEMEAEVEETDEFSVSMVAPVRLCSFFVYLTTLDAGSGGETFFPKLGLKVRPEARKAILWCNVRPDNALMADARVIHRGCPVKGEFEKLGMNIWIDGSKVAAQYRGS